MLSFVPKMVGIVALLRLLPLVGASGIGESVAAGPSAGVLLGGLAVASMLIGNLLALRQQSLFRLFAYSGVAHAGYMLMGLAVGPSAGLADGVERRVVLPGRVRPDDDRRVRPVRGRQHAATRRSAPCRTWRA